MTTWQTFIAAGSLSLLAGACGGAAVTHNGYPSGESDPWTSAKKMKLNDNYEASIEGTVAFPKRERARWYVLELPAPGAISARLSMDPRTVGADVGFEILDAGFNVSAQAQNDDDIGQDKKVREAKDVRAGRTYFHVYTIGRNDVADYKIRVKYDPKPTTTRNLPPPTEGGDPRKEFPWTVPNLPPLAAVPPADDTPGRGGRKVPVEERPDTPPPVVSSDEGAPDATTVRAQIIEFSKSGDRVKITLNKGADAGVAEGWTGYVWDSKAKKTVPHGSFKIKSVKNDEAEAITGVTLDDVQNNRTVHLKPPK